MLENSQNSINNNSYEDKQNSEAGSFQKLKNSFSRLNTFGKLKVVAAGLVFITLIIGSLSVFYLSNQSQDLRNQAKEGGITTAISAKFETVDKSSLSAETLPEALKKNPELKYEVVRLKNSSGEPLSLNSNTLQNLSSLELPNIFKEGESISFEKNQSFLQSNTLTLNSIQSWNGHFFIDSKIQSFPNTINLTVNNDKKLLGTVYLGGKQASIENIKDEIFIFQYFTPPNIANDLDEHDSEPNSDDISFRKKNLVSDLESNSTQNLNGDSVIDLLVVYTPKAMNKMGGVSGIEQYATLAINNTNTIFYNSDAQTHINIAGFMKYSGSAVEDSAHDHEEDLSRMVSGNFDVIQKQIDLKADMIMLITDGYYTRNNGNSIILGVAKRLVSGAHNTEFLVTVNPFPEIVAARITAHEAAHLAGAGHNQNFFDGEIWTNPYFSYGHGFIFDGWTYDSYTVMSYGNDDMYLVPALSSPFVYADGVQMGSENLQNNAKVVRERARIMSGFNAGNCSGADCTGGEEIEAQFVCGYPWNVRCNDNAVFTESNCEVQTLFMSTWVDHPGGGYAKWKQEACGSHGGVNGVGLCPNQQLDPIGGCVTMNCPNGDTNNDNNCTQADDGANTQEVSNGTSCAHPSSGFGDINIYRTPFSSSNPEWGLYCGNIFKSVPSGGNNTPPTVSSCEEGNFQARFRVKYLNGTDHGWVDQGNFIYGASPYFFQNFEHAVFMNNTTNLKWNGSVALTIGSTETVIESGEIGTLPEPWSVGTYKIAPIVNGVKCVQHEKTITVSAAPTPTPTATPTPIPTATPTPTPVPLIAPTGFTVTYDTTTQKAKTTWNKISNNPQLQNYRVEKCLGAGCNNFTEIATVLPGSGSSSTVSYTDNTVIPSNQIARYRVRAYNGISFGPYTTIADSTVSWIITAKAVCPNGNTSTKNVKLIHAAWPPNPVQWITSATSVGSITLPLTSTHSWNNYYVRLWHNGVTITPTGTPPNSNILYGSYFNPPTPMAKINRTLPSGSYEIKYLAPSSACN